MNKIIFLDIDGVVTSTIETPGSYLTHAPEEYGISPSCIKRIIELCNLTDSKIVISSNWRRFPIDGKWLHPDNFKYYKNPLSELKTYLNNFIIDILPTDRYITKSEALRLWFIKNDIKDLTYVIFDDDLREGFQTSEFKHNFVLTDGKTGINDDNIEAALNILKTSVKK